MDDLLPSYESVIQQDPWELIARYLPSGDLCAAALVCQRWHEICTPHLWGNPASHFGVQNDTVYVVALTRFKRTLYWSRLSVRELTHTLHLPPAHAEIYGGPHSEWLRDCLERLPRLQSLIVNGLPFFDHASLLTLRHSSLWWQQTHPNAFPVFGLRLLDASGCSNATSMGLAEALSHFPDLVSLDLSGTIAARDEAVLSALKQLRNLRVLRLRSLGLRDADFSIIAPAIGVRTRSLDLSDNHLTDCSARLLLEHCLKDQSYESHPTRSPLPPVRHGRPASEVEDFATEDLGSHLRRKLTQGFVGSLAIEEARNTGITHLYLSNNSITVEGISGLLRSKRLQILDIGTLAVTLRNRLSFAGSDENDLPLPGIGKLTPILAQYASEKLAYLRVNHTIITEDCPVETAPSPRAELCGDFGVYIADGAQELPALEPPQPELDAIETVVYELPGDLVQPTELPAATPGHLSSQILRTDLRKPSHPLASSLPEIKRDASYAPEPVNPTDSPQDLISPISDTYGTLSPFSASFETGAIVSPISEHTQQPFSRSRHNSTYYVEERRARLDLRQSQEHSLHPGLLPKVHTLVLTDVPEKTDDRGIIDRLIQFIKDCAEETEISKLRAKHTYALPPGRSRKVAEREYARSLFRLRRIVLEVAPPQTAPKKITTSWRAYPTKSSTEDADSEAFWEAATHDFSFFGDEECGLPNAEPGRGPPLAAMSGLMLASRRPAPPPKPRLPEPEIRPVFDVVAEIGRFRRDRKAAYEAALRLSEEEPSVQGYWSGEITVVRAVVDPESVDYYGNQFESGWLYR